MALSTEIPRSFRLYVTHVDGESHFLRISGQLDQQASLMVESLFETARENLEIGVGAVSPGAIHEGVICAAKYKDGTYYRAKVISMTNIESGLVGVHFIDFGNKDIISLSTIRFLDNYDPMFLQLRGQATDFYLARVINPMGRWEENMIMKLQSLLCYSEYPVTLDVHTQSLPIISIKFKGNDLSSHLVSIRFGMAIPIAKQELLLLQGSETQQMPNWQSHLINDSPAFSEHVPFLLNQNFPANPASAMRLQQSVGLPFNGSIPTTPSLISKRLLNNKASRSTVNLRAPIRQPQHVTGPAANLVPTTPPPAVAPTSASAKPTSPKKFTTYKSKLLEVNSQHKVFVSYAEEGPELFAVQLVTDAKKLQDMMDEINRRPHSSLAEPPMIGTVCLGRMSGDRIICRAIVMNLSGSQCKLFFVDFGDTEMVSYYDIFDIPEEFVKPNVFAMRFCLSGVKKLEKGPHLNEAFKQLASGNVLTLKVVSPEGPPLIQYGELFLDNKNILDLLMANMKDKLQFKWLGMLPMGARHSVLVSYVDSCIKFYVQLSDTIDDLTAVMAAVKVHCENSSSPGELPVGASCCARFPDDGKWYRARVRDVKGQKVTVAYVDYGNEQEIDVSELRTITPELIRLPAVAMKCALKGFENKPVETKTSNQLEMLALEKTLIANVVGALSSDTMLVTLVDDTASPPLDVARRMNQLSQPRSSQEIKATTPVRKDAPDSFSSPEGSVPEEGHKRSFRREKSFKEDRRPRDGNEEFPQRGSSFRNTSPEGSASEDRRGGFRREKSFKDSRRPPRDSNEDFSQRGGSFRSRDKDNFDRSGPGRHSEKFGGRPERGDKNDRNERRGGSKPWENNNPAPSAQATPLPADDDWEETPAQNNNSYQPPPRQNNRDNRDNNRERRKPREQQDRAGQRPSWKKDSGVGKRLKQAAEDASVDTQNVPRGSIQDRLRRDNRFNQEEREEISNDDHVERTGTSGSREGRPDRRENRGERRDNWGDKGPRRDFGNKDRNDFGNKDRNDFGNRDRNDFGNRDRSDFGNKDRNDFGNRNRSDFGNRERKDFGNRDRNDFGNKDRSDFGNRDRSDFGNRDRKDFGNRGGRSNFTPRDRAERSFDDNKSDKSFRSQGSGDKMGRAPPFKARSKFTQVQYKEIEDPVPLETPFEEPSVELGTQHEVSVTWIISPSSFYTQILSNQPKFLEMMHKIPDLYKGVKPYSGNVPVGASVLARYPADGVLYRATVVSVQPFSKFIVRYVDFGNKQLVDVKDIWQMDRQLMELPKMAVHCSLIGVAPKDGEWKADTEIDLCFNAPRYQCVFQEVAEDQYKVSLWNNGVSVADTLVEKELAVMSEHQSSVTLKDEPIDMTIIVGQQILCRVTHVESYGKFTVQLDIEKAALVEETIANYDLAKLTPPAPELIVEGTHCTVKHDGKIYRAVLQDTSDTANIKALLADYGNEIVTSLDNVMILPTELSVYYYQALQCCLNNYTAESETLMSLDEMKTKLTGNKFIVYVNDVDGITLVTTLYDAITGHKISIFSPDEGAYDEVVPLCMRAVFNYNFGMAYISHAENLNEFYLQKSTDGERLAQLLDELYKFYEEGSSEALTDFEVDTICAARSTDGNWYRATVVTVDDDQVKVHFTDYGNSETVAKDSLKKLDSKFYEPCSLALVASLGLVALQDDALTKLIEWTTEKEVQVTLSFGSDGWLANLHLDGVDQSIRLINEKLAAPQAASCEEEEPKPEAPVEEPASLPEGCFQVYISHIDTPGHFWLQTLDKVDKVEEIQAELQAQADSYPEIESRDMGTLCAAKYLADEQWYRAEILDSDADITTVRFLDYGNTDVLDTRPGLIKALPDRLKELERFAIKSSVNAVPTGTGEWSEAACERFTELVGDLSAPVDVLVVLKDATTYVDIFVRGDNLTDRLVEAGHAARAEPGAGGDLPSCFASHVNSPSEFWIQLEAATADLQAMEAAMVDAEGFPALAERAEGVLCAAQYPEDGAWYRAQVVVDGSEGTEVLFMDYGNASIANELRSLPDELKVKPALSRKCALQKPRDIKSWSRKSEVKFNELAAEGATIFNVQFIASGDISIVELYLDGRSVTEELVGLCEEQRERPAPLGQARHADGKICYVQSLDEFYVHLLESLPEVDRVTNALTEAADFEPASELKVGSVCAAFWPEDEQWYRAKVLEFCDAAYHVQFIDYGNKAKSDEFRQLPEELAAMEPLAKCCRLAGAPDDGSLHESGRNKLDELAVEDATFRIEYLDSTKEPTLVKVLIDGTDLVSMLTSDLPVSNREVPEEVSIKSHIDTLNKSTEETVSSVPVSEEISIETNLETLNKSTEEMISSESMAELVSTETIVEQHNQLNKSIEETVSKTVQENTEKDVDNAAVEEPNKNIENKHIESHDTVLIEEYNNAADKDDQFDDAEDDLDIEKLNTSQPDLEESMDSTDTVIENKSFEAQADNLNDDITLDEGVKTETPTTPEIDTSTDTLESSAETIKTPEKEESKDSINTDTGYTSSGDQDKSSNRDIESPKIENSSRTMSPESPIQSPQKKSSESPNAELSPEKKRCPDSPKVEQSPEKKSSESPKVELSPEKKSPESPNIELSPEKKSPEAPNAEISSEKKSTESPKLELSPEKKSPESPNVELSPEKKTAEADKTEKALEKVKLESNEVESEKILEKQSDSNATTEVAEDACSKEENAD